MIPQSDPGASYRAQRSDIDEAIARVLNSGHYILGAEVSSFEKELADYLGVRHALGVASGTDALELALRAVGVCPGDTVLTVSHTAVATVSAVSRIGAKPAFVDIDWNTMTLDALCLMARLERWKGTFPRAIIPVHLYGQPASMGKILKVAERFDIPVIEDCAQAQGATMDGKAAGTLGRVGCFSFYPTKNLGAIGDGGAVVTNDDQLHVRLTQLRQYGWQGERISVLPGISSRLDELQAAVLRVRLTRLDADNRLRRTVANRYDRALSDCGLILPYRRPNSYHVFHQYVVRSPNRDALRQHLLSNGVSSAIHYPVPVHQQPAYRSRGLSSHNLPNTELVARQVLSLPIFPQLSEFDTDHVICAIKDFSSQNG